MFIFPKARIAVLPSINSVLTFRFERSPGAVVLAVEIIFTPFNLGKVVIKTGSPIASPGAIWIATPNANSFLIDSFKGWSRDIDFPRHRQIFSYPGLQEILNKCGLEPDLQHTDRINSVINFVACTKNLFGDSAISLSERVKIILMALLRLTKQLCLPMKNVESESPELVVICRKIARDIN